MQHRNFVTGLTAGALASLVALAACSTSAQTQSPESAKDDARADAKATIVRSSGSGAVVTRPTKDNQNIVVTYRTQDPRSSEASRTRSTVIVEGQPTNETHERVVTWLSARNPAFGTTQDRAAGKAQDIRIERRIVDGKEEVKLWINGKEVKVDSMEDVHKAIRESDLDVDVQVFTELQTVPHVFEFNDVENMIVTEPFEMSVPHFALGDLLSGKAPKAMLGVHLEPISDDLREYLGLAEGAGARVAIVVEDTPAAKAGLQKGDIILAVKTPGEEHDGLTVEKLREVIAQCEPGAEVTFTLLRKGEKKTAAATLAQWDGSRFGAIDGQRLLFKDLEPSLRLGDLPNLKNEFFHDGRLLEVRPQLQELQPRLLELQRRTGDRIRKAMPEAEEMFRRMEQQMEEMQRMLENLRKQQDELRKQVQQPATSDA